MAFQFTHRPTRLPGGNDETDKVVCCDGVAIGRVHIVEAGQQEGLWVWSCYWGGADANGTAATLEEGLQAIKGRTTPEALTKLPPPPPVWNRGGGFS